MGRCMACGFASVAVCMLAKLRGTEVVKPRLDLPDAAHAPPDPRRGPGRTTVVRLIPRAMGDQLRSACRQVGRYA